MEQSISPGATLSRYRIIERIGAGGMGEVYKAHDASLERSIALKILPPELVVREDRLQRFVQEAKSASALSHPNIVTVHEIGHGTLNDDGNSGPFHFIAMELVEGDTLRTAIYRERRKLRTLLDYLAQAADGLAKAHAAGIIHRDLKPENIMVTQDGFAKVLDFGLAKLIARNEPLSRGADAPTAVKEKTREGVILGTLGYMSPEQIEAKNVDGRSDIFSFGCILYEAVTRKKPFSGGSEVDLLHNILHADPLPVAEIAPDVPWELRRIIRRCLEKDPDRRYQSMKDLAIELRDLVDEFDQLTPGSGARSIASGSGEHPQPRRDRTLLFAAVIAGAIAIVAAAFLFFFKPAPQPLPLAQMTLKPLTAHGKVRGGALSPDGRYLVYGTDEGGEVSLHLKQIVTGSEVTIMGPSPTLRLLGLRFSRDGNYVYVTAGEAGSRVRNVSVVPALGGTPRVIIRDADSVVALSPDEKEVAFIRRQPVDGRPGAHLIIAAADGTGERIIATRSGQEFFGEDLDWSPDGKWIAAIAGSSAKGMRISVLVMSPDGKEVRDLLPSKWFEVSTLAWMPDASGVVLSGQEVEAPMSQIWFFSFPGGEPRRITNDLNSYGSVSVTADGQSIGVMQGENRHTLWRHDGRGATALNAEGERHVPATFQLLSDGSVVYQHLASGNLDLWRWMPNGERRQLTTHPRADYEPVVAPAGDAIYFLTERNGAAEYWRTDVNGGDARPVGSVGADVQGDVSPDGRWLVFPLHEKLWRLATAGGEKELVADVASSPVEFSPDGAHLAGFFRLAPLPWPSDLAIMPAGGGTPRKIADVPPAASRDRVRWTPDGRAVAYVHNDAGVANIWTQPIDGGAPSRLTKFDSGLIRDFRWSSDGTQLYVNRLRWVGDYVMISNFR